MGKRPIAVDLFAGAGGMTLGFEQAGFDVLASVEIDPIHCSTHEFNFPQWAIICADISKLSGKEIRARSEIGDKEIDLVFGGPPCQGFSMIGKRMLDDPRNSLLSHFVRIVKELRPKYFVMENVKGLTVGNQKSFLKEVIGEFETIGYTVEDRYQVLNAAEFGVPQDRRRLFLFGCRDGLTLPEYPQPQTNAPKSKSLSNLPDAPTVRDAISDLPDHDRFDELWEQDWVKAKLGKPTKYSAFLRGLAEDPSDYSYPREWPTELLTSSMRTEHTALSKQRFEKTEHGKVEPISRFFKLHPQGVSNTLRAGTPSNRGAFTSPRPIHPEHPRVISVREAARLHSYPDWFRFHSTKWHGFRQIGNSVPPLLARAVAGQIMKALKAKPTKPKKTLALGAGDLLNVTMVDAAAHFNVHRHVIEPRLRGAEVG